MLELALILADFVPSEALIAYFHIHSQVPLGLGGLSLQSEDFYSQNYSFFLQDLLHLLSKHFL